MLTAVCFPEVQHHFYELFSVVDIAQGKGTEGYECGYLTFYVWGGGRPYQYEPRSGTQYGPCTASKQYACESRKFIECITLVNPYHAEFLFSLSPVVKAS